MHKYFVGLIVVGILTASVIIGGTNTAEAGPPPPPSQTCIDYCDTQPVCFCTSKFLDIPRQVNCEANPTCTDTLCQCDPQFECKKKEERLILQSFPPQPAPQCNEQ
jgi:hypothetical protein